MHVIKLSMHFDIELRCLLEKEAAFTSTNFIAFSLWEEYIHSVSDQLAALRRAVHRCSTTGRGRHYIYSLLPSMVTEAARV